MQHFDNIFDKNLTEPLAGGGDRLIFEMVIKLS